MKQEKKTNIETKPGIRPGKIFTFSNLLWVLVSLAFIVFIFVYGNTLRTETKIEIMVELNQKMKESVQGEYEDKEIRLNDLRYVFLTNRDKEELLSTLKSIVEYEYYELADTVYDSSLTFHPFKVSMKLDAVYEDLDIHKELGIDDWKSLSDEDFIRKTEDYISNNFEYEVREKIDIQTFIEEKIGQCYSYSELMFLLGKERGMDVRIELNEYHSWNSYVDADGEIRDFDMTLKLEVEKNEE